MPVELSCLSKVKNIISSDIVSGKKRKVGVFIKAIIDIPLPMYFRPWPCV
jgi:hypothetical protein